MLVSMPNLNMCVVNGELKHPLFWTGPGVSNVNVTTICVSWSGGVWVESVTTEWLVLTNWL